MASKDTSIWIGDGSDHSVLKSSYEDGVSLIEFSSATKGTPFNIRLDATNNDLVPLNSFYFDIQVTDISDSTLAVGMVSKSGFLPGWKTKGYFYNGNITNGSAGLIIGFGSPIRAGDIIGVYLDRESGQCRLIFYHNQRCLGAGFALAEMNDVLYPCLHLSGKATVKFSIPKKENFPTIFKREEVVRDRVNSPYNGKWVINQALQGHDRHELSLPPNSECIITIATIDKEPSEGEVKQYQLQIKVCNSFRTSFRTVRKVDSRDQIEAFGPCVRTLMLPSPECAKMEEFIQSTIRSDFGDFMECFRTISIGEDEKLVFSGRASEISCSRYVEVFDPVESIS